MVKGRPCMGTTPGTSIGFPTPNYSVPVVGLFVRLLFCSSNPLMCVAVVWPLGPTYAQNLGSYGLQTACQAPPLGSASVESSVTTANSVFFALCVFRASVLCQLCCSEVVVSLGSPCCGPPHHPSPTVSFPQPWHRSLLLVASLEAGRESVWASSGGGVGGVVRGAFVGYGLWSVGGT